MKEIYSFSATKKITKATPILKQNEAGETVESTKEVEETISTRVIFAKPSMATIEDAEFFYGQEFNKYINAGFLTKAMLSKKMGDIGGFASKLSIEGLQKSILDNMSAAKTIEFYGGSKDLNDEQKEKLAEAERVFVQTKSEVFEYEQIMRSQFSQTADAKAEQKLIEWLVFNQSFYEEKIGDKTQLFPLFEGDSFDEKRSNYLGLCENFEDIEDPSLLKIKYIFDQAFTPLVRVASIWYNKIAEKPEDIEKAMKEMFEEEPEKLEKPATKKAKKKNAKGETDSED